jgi:hypothetical protein
MASARIGIERIESVGHPGRDSHLYRGLTGVCRRKIEMSPVVQSRNDTPVAADTLRAKRHVGRELGEGGGVKGRSRRSRCAKRSP